jgi:hypothetical protein
MRHLGRLRTILFYSGLALEIIGAFWALVATDRSIPQRLAPLLLGYALMLVAYLCAKLAVRYWSRPNPEVWDRIAERLLALSASDEHDDSGPTTPSRRRTDHPGQGDS